MKPNKPDRTPDWKSAEASNHFAAALRHHQAGDPRAAEHHYRQALAADPGHVDSLHYLGVLAHQVGRNDVAIDLIGQAIARNGSIPECHYNIGLAYGALGRFADAAAHNRRAIALKPDYAEAHANLGNALAAQRQFAEALTSYRHALTLRPSSPETHYNIANVLAEFGRRDEAIQHYAQALALKPDYAEAYNNLGTVLTAQGKPAEAIAAHERAIALKPGLVAAHVNLGNALREHGRKDEAIARYRGAIALDERYAEAHNNLGGALLARGDVSEAAACFERALALKPDLAEASVNLAKALIVLGDLGRALRLTRQAHDRHETAETRALFFLCLRDPRSIPYATDYREYLIHAVDEPWGNPRPLTGAATSVIRENPAITACVARAEAAWPARLGADELFGAAGLAPIAEDRLLRALLESVQNTDIALERFLTSVRTVLLHDGMHGAIADGALLTFYCALARQCFINEYVFAYPPTEAEQVNQLRERVSAALAGGTPVAPLSLVALAAFMPLHTLPMADALLARAWPDPVRAVLAQQVSQPDEEAQLRAAMPRLTEIKDADSQAIRQQYEENPYPRWTKMSPTARPQTVDAYLGDRFPLAPFRPLGLARVDYLIAGCGAGQQVASVAQVFSDTRITAIDLSLASLGYARRMAAVLGLSDIAFGQADILELGKLGRTFDVIDSSGVLHHFADVFAGWRVLLSILRPGGIMRVALYSTIARRDIAAARRYIAQRGYRATPEDIRQCRQDIMAMDEREPIRNTTKLPDFFSLSDCRDHLFHVRENTLEIPQIGAFLAEQGLTFLGFEVEPGAQHRYAERFPDDPAKTNLDHWHAFEQDNSDTFLAMYEFWLQKRQA